uniref:Prohormone-3 neuropeptide n=1 Tax=Platynereis dumerilii TaxID=6359 RepID=V5TCE1_PLADU|nr:prohormone-3 neuropeptide precursor [Platynereis dumerilii]
MKSSTFLAVFATLLATALGWSKYYEDSFDELPARRSYCVNSGGKCFTSSECCKGYVCAAFDDLFGRHVAKRIEPGYCILEKSLKPCAKDVDCAEDARCVSLGRKDERYCIQRADSPNDVIYRTAGPKAKLGQECTTNADCEKYGKDGNELCCQKIRRFRQKAKTICDRVNHMSACIPN